MDLQVSPVAYTGSAFAILIPQRSAFVEPLTDSVAERLLSVPISSRSYEYEIIFAPTPASSRCLQAYDLASPATPPSFTKRDSWRSSIGKKVRFCYQRQGDYLQL